MQKLLLFFIPVYLGCRQYYDPPDSKKNVHYLVVDGILNSSPDSTYIKLSYTRNLNDTSAGVPVINATMLVEGDQNTLVLLPEIRNGVYGGGLTLNRSEKYRLSINTTDGRQYLSDFVPYKQTPAIDSISWDEDDQQVNFYVNTHDPQNSTIYYRWQFEETWQYNTYLNSGFDFINGEVVRRTPDQQILNCWQSSISPSILLASTSQLSQDVVSHFLFNNVSKSTEKIFDLYSVQISQYALTRDEFEYWTDLKKNSQQLGTLFDAQPSQLNSNIRCITNPTEPVMGYLSASSVQKKRIFLSIYQLNNYNYTPYYLPCEILKDVTTAFSPYDTSRVYEYLEMPNHLFTYWYYDGVNHVAENFCIDCREHGGTNVKPSYWP